MKTISTFLLIALLAVSATAQTADLTVVNGLPNLTADADMAVDGTTTLTAIAYATTASTTLAAGTYTIDILDSGTVLVSGSLTVAAGDNVTAVAHLLDDGTQTLTFFVNDLSAAAHYGDGRLVVRHVADIDAFRASFQASTYFGGPHHAPGGSLTNGGELSFDRIADSYDMTLTQTTTTTTNTNPFGGPHRRRGHHRHGGSGGGTTTTIFGPEIHTVTADMGTIIYVVGIENDASFMTVVQTVALTPATAPVPTDLSVTGTLVGGSWAAGGDITYGLTGAGAGALVMVFVSQDNTAQTTTGFWSLGLGIGGNGWIFPVAQGMADSTGAFTQTFTVPAGMTGFAPNGAVTLYHQAISFGSGLWGGSASHQLSDIESIVINP